MPRAVVWPATALNGAYRQLDAGMNDRLAAVARAASHASAILKPIRHGRAGMREGQGREGNGQPCIAQRAGECGERRVRGIRQRYGDIGKEAGGQPDEQEQRGTDEAADGDVASGQRLPLGEGCR